MSGRCFLCQITGVALVGLLAGAWVERTARGQSAEAAEAAPAQRYEVEASAYYLVSGDSKVVAYLELADGEPCFALLDDTGAERIAFETDTLGSPSLRLSYPDGSTAVEVTHPPREIRLREDTEIRVHIGERPPDRPGTPANVDPRSPLARLLAKLTVRAPSGEVKWTTDQFLKP